MSDQNGTPEQDQQAAPTADPSSERYWPPPPPVSAQPEHALPALPVDTPPRPQRTASPIRPQRPATLTVAAVLWLLGAAWFTFGGLYLLARRGELLSDSSNPVFSDVIGRTSLIAIIASFGFAMLYTLIGYLILRGNLAGSIIGTVVTSLAILLGVAGAGADPKGALFVLALCGVMLWLLWNARARVYFGLR